MPDGRPPDTANKQDITFFKMLETAYHLAQQGHYDRAARQARQANGYWSEVKDE